MNCTSNKRELLKRRHLTAQNEFAWHDLQDENRCDSRVSNSEREYSLKHVRRSRGGQRLQVAPHNLALTSPPNEKPQSAFAVEDEKDTYLGQDKTTRVSSKRIVSNSTTQASIDIRREYHLDTTRRHLDQSEHTASKPNDYLSQNQHAESRFHYGQARYQSQPSSHLSHRDGEKQALQLRSRPLSVHIARSILFVVALNATLNHLTHMIHLGSPSGAPLRLFAFPKVARAESVIECSATEDCQNPDKICYESKCICGRIRPIEDKERSECLPHASLNEACTLAEQCIGNSICIEGICSCPSTDIDIYNPSTKLRYCHPKRRLHDECNFDAQCPENSFCSNKNGCLCQNGYGGSLVRGSDGKESRKCLAKTCASTSQCESKFHICDDNRCKCSAAHFDPHTAGCYEFGSTGGEGIIALDGNTTMLDNDPRTTSIINDLMKNGDRLWLIVIILGVLTLIFLIILIMLLRRHYLGLCWTRTKEYEPNNDNLTKNGQFHKNSINNKSFRRKNGDLDEEEAGSGADDTAADHSSLVTASSKKNGALLGESTYAKRSDNVNENHYVQVDMRAVGTTDGADDNQRSPSRQYQRPHHQVLAKPLPSSTSTPV